MDIRLLDFWVQPAAEITKQTRKLGTSKVGTEERGVGCDALFVWEGLQVKAGEKWEVESEGASQTIYVRLLTFGLNPRPLFRLF